MGYGIKIFVPRPLHYVTRSPGNYPMNFNVEIVTSLEGKKGQLFKNKHALKDKVKLVKGKVNFFCPF